MVTCGFLVMCGGSGGCEKERILTGPALADWLLESMVTDPIDPATSKGIGLRPQIVCGTSGMRCDLLLFGRTRRWRFSEKAVGSACGKVRFQVFRTVTFDTIAVIRDSRKQTLAIRCVILIRFHGYYASRYNFHRNLTSLHRGDTSRKWSNSNANHSVAYDIYNLEIATMAFGACPDCSDWTPHLCADNPLAEAEACSHLCHLLGPDNSAHSLCWAAALPVVRHTQTRAFREPYSRYNALTRPQLG